MIDIGRVGIWQSVLNGHPASRVREAVAQIEEMGWSCVWIPEATSRDPFVTASMILESTTTLKVATGIANMWVRDAMCSANASKTLNEAYENRFLLGLGVSHRPIAEGIRKHTYARPYSMMRAYLELMDASPFQGIEPSVPPNKVIAALGPKMLALGAELADGVHPYFVPVEHTEIARAAVGSDKIVATELMVILETDPTVARDVARTHMGRYLALDNYAKNLINLGYTADELSRADDRVVDAIVAWGSLDDVATRVREHLDAGASHVCVQVLNSDRSIPISAWHELADALL